MLSISEIIRKKRDNQILQNNEISHLIQGITNHSVSDAQIAAFAMAIFWRGMTSQETADLTHAMANSGQVIDWSSLNLEQPILDKHSTGGLGDKVSLLMAPIVAACGGYLPMIAGRGLGHTGGTIDKLESIPGYNAHISIEEFIQVTQDIRCAIIGQTAELAPADKRFYAVRDITSTVESLPLIVASVLSKKIAKGTDALILDIKYGSGAFMATNQQALALAQTIQATAQKLKLKTKILLTDMNQVLGSTAGNALEIQEVCDYFLNTKRESRLHEVTRELSAELLVLANLATDLDTARASVDQSLGSGKAAEIFSRMISSLGGPTDFLEKSSQYLEAAPEQIPVFTENPGYIHKIDTRSLGLAIIELGGGRKNLGDIIDNAVGLSNVCGIGEFISSDKPIAMVHARDKSKVDSVFKTIKKAFVIREESISQPPTIQQRLES